MGWGRLEEGQLVPGRKTEGVRLGKHRESKSCERIGAISCRPKGNEDSRVCHKG